MTVIDRSVFEAVKATRTFVAEDGFRSEFFVQSFFFFFHGINVFGCSHG